MHTIKERIDAIAPEIRETAHLIHEDPELGNQEFHAVGRLTGLLEKYGFTITRKVCGLETAFIASYKSTKPGPVIGFLAEYDALRGMGHACGHNMIGTLACCNAIALREAIDAYGGEVRVIGAPAEETTGGKVVLAEAGCYDDLAVAMMAHPYGRHAASGSMYAIDSQRFEFYGKSAHAGGAPEEGINALNGVIETFNLINALRQHIRKDANISGVITCGGTAANIVPDYASADFYIRASESTYLHKLSEQVKNCARGAALGTGTRVEITNFEGWYDNLHTNETLSARAVAYTRAAGVTQTMEADHASSSSDIGTVSYRCPAIHQWFDVTGDPSVSIHTPGLRAGADSDYGYAQMFIVAQAFVQTAEDILKDPAFLAAIRAEHEAFITGRT